MFDRYGAYKVSGCESGLSLCETKTRDNVATTRVLFAIFADGVEVNSLGAKR